MKDVRDNRLIGIGFIAGIVLCCFVALAEPPTFIGSIAADRKTAPIALPTNGTGKAETIWYVTNVVTHRAVIPAKDSNAWLRINPVPLARPETSVWRVIKPHTPMLAPGIEGQKPGKVSEIDLNLLNWNQGFIPNLNERRMRIEPALKINNQFPGGPVQYDLIDLNYKPDFKLPD